MAKYESEQFKLNKRAIAIGAKITVAPRYDVTLADGTHYAVSTRKELYSLIKQLEQEHGF
jgi:hypothetical protein